MKSSLLPGPGHYEYQNENLKNNKKGYSFGKSLRSPLGKKSSNLGPGSYNADKTTFKSKFGFIGKAKRSLNHNKNSTPGYYDVPVTVPNLSMYHYASNKIKK
jgi:hypothetical protein